MSVYGALDMWQCNCAQCRGDGPPDPPECPDTCQSMQVFYAGCGGIGECHCFPPTWRGMLNRWWQGPCEIDPEPTCDCPSAADIRAERAERCYEAERDR